jgi:hypothetical protein
MSGWMQRAAEEAEQERERIERLDGRMAELEAENARLRRALEKYANQDNWVENADWPSPHWIWIGTHPIPARIAQAALAPTTAESEVKE